MKTILFSLLALLGFGFSSCSWDEPWYALSVEMRAEVVNERSVPVIARFQWKDPYGNQFNESVFVPAGESYQWFYTFSDYEGMGIRYDGSLVALNQLGADNKVERTFDEDFSAKRGLYEVVYRVIAEE
ncbi:MAG: hypothetical protein ACO3DK_02965 [Bacteroidia bacterium]